MVTFSRAITEPPVLEAEASSNATAPSNIFGVMGADIFLSYFERLLKATVTECNHGSSACIVIDLSGKWFDCILPSWSVVAHFLVGLFA